MRRQPMSREDAALVLKHASTLRSACNDPANTHLPTMRATINRMIARANASAKQDH